MKKLTQFLPILAVLLMSLASCDNAQQMGSAAEGGQQKIDFKAVRGKLQSLERFTIDEAMKSELAKAPVIELKKQSEDDAVFVSNVYKNMMSANQKAQTLQVTFSMSNAPIENGIFIFGIESPTGQELILEMFDEEGFQLAANNKIGINAGNNYRALNVKSLESGEYTLRLRNEQGDQLMRKVSIEQQ